MPVKYPADGMLYVGWLVDATGEAITDVAAPETAELSGIVDLSCDIQSGGVDPGITTGRIDAASICSAFVAMSVGRTTVAPTLTFWRYEQPDDTAWDLAVKGTLGWLIIRTGIASETALADGQDCMVAYLEMSEPTPTFPGGDTNSTFDLSFELVTGQKFTQKATIGGAS